MLNILAIIAIIILSPIILIAAVISFFILIAVVFTVGAWIVSILMAIVKEVRKRRKQEDLRNIQK